MPTIRSIQALRFVFIMLVVVHHVPSVGFAIEGESGVAFFFVLSGFVLAYAYGDRVVQGQFRHGAFLRGQLLKFYPLHLLLTLVMALLAWWLGTPYGWPCLLAHGLLVQSWVPVREVYFALNAPSWFLSSLLFSYLLFPAAYRLLARISWQGLLALGIAVVAVYAGLVSQLPADQSNLAQVYPPLRVIDFCLGMVACRCWRSSWGQRTAARMQQMGGVAATAAEVIAVTLLVAFYYFCADVPEQWRCASLFWPLLPPLLLFFVMADQCKGALTWLLHRPAAQWLAACSLEIYLTHMLTLRLCYHFGHLDDTLPPVPAVWLVLLVAVVGVAWLAKRGFVAPLYNYLKVRVK